MAEQHFDNASIERLILALDRDTRARLRIEASEAARLKEYIAAQDRLTDALRAFHDNCNGERSHDYGHGRPN
jgi:hypothetical protein